MEEGGRKDDFSPEHELEDAADVAVERLKRDLARSAGSLPKDQARYLVDLYYSIQKQRVALEAQIRSTGTEPHALLTFIVAQLRTVERQARRSLDEWTKDHAPSAWARTIPGVGPVIAAGLRAHIDIERARTAGAIWRFGGLDPSVKWEKGKKRPWNATLKVLLWKLGRSFVYVQPIAGDIYGKIYAERKAIETAKNEAGAFKAQAEISLATKKWNKDTEAYKAYIEGRLPKARIQLRAMRYAVKLFLSHYHTMLYRDHYGTEPPRPYAIEHLGHAHMIEVPEPAKPKSAEQANRAAIP